MKTKAWIVTLAVAMFAAGAWAQEADTEATEDDAAPAETHERLQIHDRAAEFAPYFGDRGYDFGPSSPYYEGMPDRYAIGSYYRGRLAQSRSYGYGYGYAPFWSHGYGYAGRTRAGMRLRYGRNIGANGDVFLFAPTILGPVGPLTGVFASGE